MKKIFLLLSFIPIGLFAQNSNTPVAHTGLVKYHPIKEGYVSPVQNHVQPQPTAPIARHSSPAPAPAYVPAVSDIIGTTVYDLQTNGSLARRLQVYSPTQASYVWIKSDDVKDPDFVTRYSGYTSYDGSSWLTPNTKQYEFARSGWPSIGEVTTNDSTYEMLTSHYAQATTGSYSGGIYWYKNSGIGKTDFTQTVDLSSDHATTSGLLWPRMATSGNKIYMIGTYEDDRTIKGVINPDVYFCYNMSTRKFEAKGIALPGYDSTRYGSGGADEYAIDARDSFVAILIGSDLQGPGDLALWKSSDSGKTFKKTVIDSFAAPIWNFKTDQYTFINDTVETNDGTVSVALDNDGVAHVSYSPMFITYQAPYATGDSGVSYFNDNSGIVYWNDKDKQKINVGGSLNYDSASSLPFDQNQYDENYSGYGHNFDCFSNVSVDANHDVYVVFSAPNEDDIYNGNWVAYYRHVYCSVYNAASGKWLPQQDIVQTRNVENVYATVARDADTKLRMVFMQDDVPGIFFPGLAGTQQLETTDTMIYQEISTADLLGGKVGLELLGVNENAANKLFSTESVFPNPANNQVNISLNLAHSATVTVKLYNMLGAEMQAQNYSNLPAGKNNLQLGLSSLQQGVYLCNITAGGYTTTQRVVVER